jgi:hypothetical protein
VFTGDLPASQDLAADSLPPFAMRTAFPSSDYYGGSAPLRGRWPTTSPPAAALAARSDGRPRSGSHVHHVPIDGGGAQLFPGSLAASTPQTFLAASGHRIRHRDRSRRPANQGGVRHIPAPIRQI